MGAFVAERMVGFVHHLAAVRANNEIFGYSHVMAVAKDYQNKGVGARLKWAQRERALGEGRKLIKWTWDPMMSRNAHFNLNRLGAIVDTYSDNFYGMDYNLDQAARAAERSIVRDLAFRLCARSRSCFRITSRRSMQSRWRQWRYLPNGRPSSSRIRSVRAMSRRASERNSRKRLNEQLICAGFERGTEQSRYLLFEPQTVT